MARGYPDDFAQPQFPQYGETIEDGKQVTIEPGTTGSILSYSGKGVLYNAEVQVVHVSDHGNDSVYFYVDNNIVSAPTFVKLYSWGTFFPILGEWCLSVYNNVDFTYVVYLVGPISFVSKIEIKYKNEQADAVSPWGYMTYTKIL